MLTHALAALASPACLLAYAVYAAITAFLPVLNGLARTGEFLNSCVLTLGTPLLAIFLTLSAGHALMPPSVAHAAAGGAAGNIQTNIWEIVTLLVLAVLLCLALAAIEFGGIDTRGLPTYLVGIITMKLYIDANAAHAPLYPGSLATLGIFALVAFLAILLRLVATEEAGDIAVAFGREVDQARSAVKQSLTPALNFIPAILGACLYGALTTLH